MVSGTNMTQRRAVILVMPEKIQKVPAMVKDEVRLMKNLVVRKQRHQRNDVATELANSLTDGANNSDIINQGIGPNPREKNRMNTHSDRRGRICNCSASKSFLSTSFM